MDMVQFRNLFDKAFKTWSHDQIDLVIKPSDDGFAEYLGVSRSAVTAWRNGTREPSLESLRFIAPKFADLLGPYVYDQLGLQRPEPEIMRYHQIHDNLPPEEQKKLAELVVQYGINHGALVEEQEPKSD